MATTPAWTSWGDSQPQLPRSARHLLRQVFGPLVAGQPTPIEQAYLTPSRLPAEVREDLVEAVGTDSVRDDDEARARHAGGQSYTDIVRRRHGDASEAPDAVVLPGDADEIAAVLAVCSASNVARGALGGRHECGRRTVVVARALRCRHRSRPGSDGPAAGG